jgi:UDP-N-acetylmuramoylalanine--D-glutamate ligase
MIPAKSFAGRGVGVFGLGRTGDSAVRSLIEGGANVFAWDDDQAKRALVQQKGAATVAWSNWPWERLSALVLSPGVPFTHPAPHPVVLRAMEAAVPVIGDFELFAREVLADSDRSLQAPTIAVTGTNGKSTTTALIGHILNSSGYNAQVGGNIGNAVLELDPPAPRTVYVVEISTFQIDLAPGFSPDVALLLNLSPDHIDRHGSIEAYAAVKERLVRQTARQGQVLIGVDDPFSAAIFTRASSAGAATATPISVGKVLGRGIFVVDGGLYDAQGQRATKVLELTKAEHLPGVHNWQNAAFAYAACKPFVRDVRLITDAILSFPGLAHRMEDVRRIGRVRYVNDSKATNSDATERALACFSDIFWIAGGRAKEGGIASLDRYFSRVRKAYLIGEAADEFAKSLHGKVDYVVSGTLEEAVARAAAEASRSTAAEPIVLLSPACASYDQFRDFEARGNAFREIVARISPVQVREAS